MLSWSLWSGAIIQGLAFAFLAWGVFFAFRVVRFADITVDGSFTLGAATGAVLLLKGTHPLLALLAAFLAGGAAGVVTGIIHTRFGVADLLAGILTMTALYSINLRVMGRANISLPEETAILVTPLQNRFPELSTDILWLIVFGVLAVAFWLLWSWFLRTDYGMALRATGDGPAMITAQGVDIKLTKTVGLAICNGLAATAGALMMQFQGLADIQMGIGSLVTGLAAVILGETFFGRRSLPILLLGVVFGSVLFRGLIALALQSRLDPNDLRLATAAFVLLALILPRAAFWSRLSRKKEVVA